jgi:maltooligosyltrehalose trehalohydrolase
MSSFRARRFPIGAEILPSGGTAFRVWAPRRRAVAVVTREPDRAVPLASEGDGYFSGELSDVRAGSRYQLQLDDEERLYPDPASRFQPEGPHGPSEVIDPGFRWSDDEWPGLSLRGQVLYELHVGTFTREGTYEAAARELEALRDLGVTCLELMPVAEFAGAWGWGYDGVDLFAPSHLYGRPDDLRRFVDRAHEVGLGVILDVVYNHLGPEGNYLEAFSGDYFTDRYPNEWGASFDFDGPRSGPVREFFASNAAYWIAEYHFDGLRLDATQSIVDHSPEHVLADIGRSARAAAGRRSIILTAENEPQDVRLIRSPAAGGYGLDAIWNDDFHHSAKVAADGKAEGYYRDHRGSAQELISAAKWGFLFQGQHYRWQDQRRGSPALDVAPSAFVTFLENHDQVANSAHGTRLAHTTSPGRYRALSALLLLLPSTPLLFQGQEFASSKPFVFFAGHEPELAAQVRRGRVEVLRQFDGVNDARMRERLSDPASPETFAACKLDFAERADHAPVYAMYRDLLELRRTEDAFSAQAPRALDGAVLAPEAFVLRFFEGSPGRPTGEDDRAGDRLLLMNLGPDLHLEVAPEPLLAPVEGCRWEIGWSSEDPLYGGSGTPPVENSKGEWRLPGHAAVVMKPGPSAAASSSA